MAFDPDLARLTVGLSRSVYRSEDRTRAEVAALGLEDFHFFRRDPNEALSVTDGEFLYLAFRGTERRILDWVQNAQFGPVPGELGGRVHSGFHNGLGAMWDQIEPVAVAAGKPVVLTGHSLGGALATLAGARLAEAGVDVAAIYTYGQPRVGHGDFRARFNDRLEAVTHRVVNHIDVVPRVPLLLHRYRHVGRRVYFDSDGSVHIDAGFWRVALDDVKYRITHFRTLRAAGLSEHVISAYVDLVERI
jgi:triacylglycerol lipase